MNQTTPKKINAGVRVILDSLSLHESEVKFLKLKRQNSFTAVEKYCHINCMRKKKIDGGDIKYGWTIWQNSTIGFTEAEFHAVWVSDNGEFQDITPRTDGEKRIMFVPDHRRSPILIQEGFNIWCESYTNQQSWHNKITEITRKVGGFLELDKLEIIMANGGYKQR